MTFRALARAGTTIAFFATAPHHRTAPPARRGSNVAVQLYELYSKFQNLKTLHMADWQSLD